MAQQILEGTWEEIAAHAEEFTGRRLKVIVEAEREIPPTPDIPVVGPPNEGMLAALHKIEKMQQGRRQTLGDSVKTVRYGRSGPLYDVEPIDE